MAILINGVPGSKLDASVSTVYSFTTTTAGIFTYAWSIVSAPPTNTATLTGASTATAQLTPSNEGTYLIRLTATTGSGTVQETVVLAVPSITSGLRVPAYGEMFEAGATGWDQGAGNMLRSLDLYREQAGVIACVADGIITPGSLVTVGQSPYGTLGDPASQLILSGLPGVRSLPIAFSYSTSNFNPRAPLVGIAVGKPSGGATSAAGEVVLVCVSGLYRGMTFTRTRGTDYPFLFSDGSGGVTDAYPNAENKCRCIGQVVRWNGGTPGTGTVDIMVYGNRVPRIKTIEFGSNSSTNLSSSLESYFPMGTDAPSSSTAFAQYCPRFDLEDATVLVSVELWAAFTASVATTFKVYNAGALVGTSFDLASTNNSASHSYYITVDTYETFQFTGQIASGLISPKAIAATLTFWEL